MDEQMLKTPPVRLKALLQRNHWQTYRTFCKEYDKAAVSVDPELKGTWPSRAQLYRWLSGDLKGVPYPDHCRVLEEMFPGWTADQLFERCTDDDSVAESDEVTISAPQDTVGSFPEAAAAAATVVSPVGIRPYIEAAFNREHVSIDFFGFSGETLHGVIQEPLDKIRAGQLKPRSLSLRVLVPDISEPMAVPCRSNDLSDDPDFRQRVTDIMSRHWQAIQDSVGELVDLNLIEGAQCQMRVHGCSPLFKLYILNNEEVFFGFYPIRQHAVKINGTPHPVFDLMGKEASLFRYMARDDLPTNAHYVLQARQWFTAVWETISRGFVG
jgi:hypothetical protein